jgi:hypothetical protein
VDVLTGGMSKPSAALLEGVPCYLGFDSNGQCLLFVRGHEEEGGYELSAQPTQQRQKRARQPGPVAVTQPVLEQQLAAVKAAGTAAAQAVVQQLRERFPPVQLLDAFGIVQPEFWLQPEAPACFKSAVEVLIEQYGQERTMQPALAARPEPTARVAAAAAARQAAAEEEAAAEDAAAAAQRRQQQLAELMKRIKAVNAELAQQLPAVLRPVPDEAAKVRLVELQAQLHQLDLQLGAAQAALPAVQLAPQAPTAARVPEPPPPAPSPAAVITVAPLLNQQLLLLQADTFAAEMAARAPRYTDWHAEQQAAIAAKRTPLPCPTEHLWRSLVAQRAVLDRISEFYRLAELVGCQPTGSVSNEQRFSDVNNIKTRLRSSLDVPHLNACVRIGTTSHTLNTFPFAAAYDFWNPPGTASRYGV